MCRTGTNNGTINLLLNRETPPFDNPTVGRWQLTIDRKTFVDILTEGQGNIGGAMQPPPAGCGACRPKS